ncbi:MAG: hypothetical protein ABF649_22020 [Bacillus sp. (in: firmicutes)]|uniref:hypothetical protein n=1 Tax=Sporolactobacillus sp. STSJ-5 TaxID=2965076 RepID=UPI0021068104|nr:hypothetical protein [Sporolactobacillus sp. STSJ-5]MCQ2009909.1 hypothetical protein [Sporolactobacillus sp. STSJ-5]
MKKIHLTILIILIISLAVNVTLALNWSNSTKNASVLAKKVDDYSKKLASIKKKTKKNLATKNALSELSNWKIKPKPIGSYKYNRNKTNGEIMSFYEANAIYNSDKKYQKVGLDGVQAPNPFGDKMINRATITDERAQKYLLSMINNPKERTRQRIDWLTYAVFLNKSRLKHRKVYADILTRWQNNYDFSQLTNERKTIENLRK